MGFSNLRAIIEFVYRGEIDVSESELQVSIGFYNLSLIPLYSRVHIRRINGIVYVFLKVDSGIFGRFISILRNHFNVKTE